jgi:hypothetical protein
MKYAEVTDRGDRSVIVQVGEEVIADPKIAANLIERLKSDHLNDVTDLAQIVLIHRNGHDVKQYPAHEVPDLLDGDQLDTYNWFDFECTP